VRRVTLNYIAKECLAKKGFFSSLIKNSKKTLQKNRLRLTIVDQEKLDKLLRDKQFMKDFKITMELARKYAKAPQGVIWP